jgi:hypothetical protein
MSANRRSVVSALVFAILPCAVLGAPGVVQYVGGTVKAIPANTAGSFNFDDTKEMRFNYSGSVYKLSYEQITATEISKGDGHHVFGKIPVPSLVPSKRKQTLSISYKDSTGATGTLNFELAAAQASAARDMIALKKAPPQLSTAGQTTDWWGDRYWKTNRNKGLWDSSSAQTSQSGQTAPAGTK